VAATVTAAVIIVRRGDADITPVPAMQKSDADRLFDALAKPVLKLEVAVAPDVPMHLGRQAIPGSLLLVPVGEGKMQMHGGPLYFSISGGGAGHVLDLSDQPGQAAQITNFSGEIKVKAPYLL